MLTADDKFRPMLDAIEAQWNTAEEYVKKAERLRRGLVVGSSINEFRYAGRRLVEAYSCLKCVDSDPEKESEINILLGEVRQFCLRAQHDAMDAAVTYIDQALFKLESDFGSDLLHEKFSDYIHMKEILREISSIMAQSRGNRDLRDHLYKNIKDELIDALIIHYQHLETSHEVLKAAYIRRIQNEKIEHIRFLILAGVSAIAAVAAIIAILPHKEPTLSPNKDIEASDVSGIVSELKNSR